MARGRKRKTEEPSTWFVFRTAPQKEFVAHEILNRAGFLSYTPRREEYRFANKYARAKRKKSIKKFPLMVGYILIALTPRQLGWFCYHHKPNCIHSVIGFAGVPMAIEHAIVERMAMEHGGTEHIAPDYQKFMRTHKEFSVGDNAEIMEGPMLGRSIVVEEIKGDKARAFIEMFGKPMRVEIPLMDLEYAEAAE